MNAPNRVGLILEPLDVLFFRDGRPFGAATRAGGVFPVPQTLAGALWTALLEQHGCDFAKLAALVKSAIRPLHPDWFADVLPNCGAPRWIAQIAVRGPWLAEVPAHTFDGPPCVLFPTPAIVHGPKKSKDGPLTTVMPMTSRRIPGWSESCEDQEALAPLWRTGREATEPIGGFLTAAGMAALLQGKEMPRQEWRAAQELLESDNRTGIMIDPERLTAAESQIYGASFLALARSVVRGPDQTRYSVAFYAEVDLPADAPHNALEGCRVLAFGGEGRRVAVRSVPCLDVESLEPPSSGGKPFLVLTTPGLFEGWRPAKLDKCLRAAAAPPPLAVSGWDLARGGPKPTRFAASAGSVYFLDRSPDDLGPSLCDNLWDQRQGWGLYFKGTWTDA